MLVRLWVLVLVLVLWSGLWAVASCVLVPLSIVCLAPVSLRCSESAEGPPHLHIFTAHTFSSFVFALCALRCHTEE